MQVLPLCAPTGEMMDYSDLLVRYRIPPTLVGKPVVVAEDLLEEYASGGDIVFPYAFPGLIFRYTGGIALDDHPAKIRALQSEYPHVRVLENPLRFPAGERLYVEAPPQRTRDVLVRGILLGFKEILGVARESVGIHITAEPGWREYGPLSVLAQYFYRIEAYRLPNDVFSPTPKGPMAEIRMKAHRRVKGAERFYSFLRRVFSERKRLLSSIFPGAPSIRVQDADPETLYDVFGSFYD